MGPIQILHIEDSAEDSELIRLHLSTARIACVLTRVEGREALINALQVGSYDLFLSDNRLPSFDGISALEMTRQSHPNTPFIFVVGAMDDVFQTRALSKGALACLHKDKPQDLVALVLKALKERARPG